MNSKNLFKSVMLAAFCLGVFSFASCDDNDDNHISFSVNTVQVAPGAVTKVLMGGGEQPYTAQSLDTKIATVKTLKDTLFVTGVKEGKTNAVVTDKNKLTANIVINVATPLSFDKQTVSVAVGKEDIVAVSNGVAPYTVVVADGKIATATVKDAKISIKGVKAGTTTVHVMDKNKLAGDVIVTVK